MYEHSSPIYSYGESHDMRGAAPTDHDTPYQFGRRPTAAAPFPFNTHQYVRLLILRSKLDAACIGNHR